MKLTRFDDLVEAGRTLRGRWELTPRHDIQYRARGEDEEVKFKGALVAAEPEALVIAVTDRQSDQKRVTSLVKLSGAWSVNPLNQIQFAVEREAGKNDVLTFRSGWRLDDRHQIIYEYSRAKLKTKTKSAERLVFEGVWKLTDANHLAYFLSANSASSFRLRGAFETKSILAKSGQVRYQIGAEVAGRRRTQTLVFFGKWKLSRDLELSFEMENGGKTSVLSFGGEYHFDGDRQVLVNLKTKEGKPLGVELVFTKDFFKKDGQAFIRLAKLAADSRIEAGVKFEW